jgi:hypothetical protein
MNPTDFTLAGLVSLFLIGIQSGFLGANPQRIGPSTSNTPTCGFDYPAFSFNCPSLSTVQQSVANGTQSGGSTSPPSPGMPQDSWWTYASGTLNFGQTYTFTFLNANLTLFPSSGQFPLLVCSYQSNATGIPPFNNQVGGVAVTGYFSMACGPLRYGFELLPNDTASNPYAAVYYCNAGLSICSYGMEFLLSSSRIK